MQCRRRDRSTIGYGLVGRVLLHLAYSRRRSILHTGTAFDETMPPDC